ncbi:hypothetical protein U1Q18_030484, partial [Sarracenia purpurea var. burkii]
RSKEYVGASVVKINEVTVASVVLAARMTAIEAMDDGGEDNVVGGCNLRGRRHWRLEMGR